MIRIKLAWLLFAITMLLLTPSAASAAVGQGIPLTEGYRCSGPWGSVVIAGSAWAPGVNGDNTVYSNWNGSNCANGSYQARPFVDTSLLAYQCTELAVRWAYNYRGVNPAAWGGADAQNMWGRSVAGATDITNGSATPQFGDLIVWNATSPGHVAVVIGVSGNRLYFVGENQGWGEDFIPFNPSTNQASAGNFGEGLPPAGSDSAAEEALGAARSPSRPTRATCGRSAPAVAATGISG